MPPAQTADTALAPPDALCWQQAIAQLAATLQARGVHPA